MSKLFDQLASEIFQILKGSGKTLSLFDENGKKVYDPSAARRMFAQPDKSMISLDEDGNNSEVRYFLSQSTDMKKIEKLINTLRHLTTRFNVLFSVRKYARELSPKDFAYQSLPVSESGIVESLYGSIKTSYQKINNSRLVIRHSARVNEEKRGSRTRNINHLFVENKGERFRFPLVHLSGARAWAQHLNQGGSPFDVVGQQIVELATESSHLIKINKHIWHNKSRLEESVLDLRLRIKERINEIRSSLVRLSRVKGYISEKDNLSSSLTSIVEDQDHFDEFQKLGVLLGIAADNPLSESLMPIVLLTKGEKMNNNAKFHRVVALENADDLVETLMYEYGHKEGVSWARNNKGVAFMTPESFNDAKSYLALTETNYTIEDSTGVNPNDKVLKYSQTWIAKTGGTDMGHVGDDWSPTDKKQVENKANELASGLKELLSGSLRVNPVPPPQAKAANPSAAMALKINSLLVPQAGLQNDMLHNYLSSIFEKLGSGEALSPVEKQVATKAASLVDSMSPSESVTEAPEVNDKVLNYSQTWIAKTGGMDMGHVGDDWSPTDKKQVENKANELASGLKELLSGRLSVRPVPMPATKAANPRSEMALKINCLLVPQAGLQNDMLHNYLSSIFEKLGSGEALSPVEKQVASKAVDIVNSMNSDGDVSEDIWNEGLDGVPQAFEQVSTPMGPGIVQSLNHDGTCSVELQNGEIKKFHSADIEKANPEGKGISPDSLREIAELDEWFAKFDPINFLNEDPDDVHIHVHDDGNDGVVDEAGWNPNPYERDDEGKVEKAIEAAVEGFDLSDFFKEYGSDFDWDQRHFNKEEPEDMNYPPNYVISGISAYLQKLADRHSDDANLLNADDLLHSAQNIFTAKVKPEMEKEGYTFSDDTTESEEDDMMNDPNLVVPGDVQHSFGGEISDKHISTPDDQIDEISRLRRLAGI